MRPLPARLAALGLTVGLTAAPAIAQNPDPEDLAPPELSAVEELGELRTLVGSGVLLSVYDDVERVALADEAIARAQVISTREVLFSGLQPGHTTVFLWLRDGTRLRYQLRVERDLELVYRTLRELDSGIVAEASADGSRIVLRGQVADRRTAAVALEMAERMLADRATVLSLLRYPGYGATHAEIFEAELARTLAAIDSRIRMRRIQVGPEADPAADTVVLEGRVRTIQDLRKAVTVAERQLGGSGSEIKAAGDEILRRERFRGFFGAGLGSNSGATQALQGQDLPEGGLTSKIARGLIVTSESGRVVSFLEVDEIPQIMVSIRVVEVNRAKARRLGINWGYQGDHLAGGSAVSPGLGGLPNPGNPGSSARPVNVLSEIGQASNLVGAFVDQATSIIAAIDFLEEKALARSVAEPNVLTLSGEPATVVVGGEVPIPSTSVNQVTAIQGFFFQDFGVRLDIRPTAVGNDLVALEVSPSIVRPTPSLGNNDVPGFTVQSVQTTARVQAGESLVLGGLLSFDEGLEERGIPGLSWIPGLGRWRKKIREQRELLFVISPRMIETPGSPEPPETIRMPDLDLVEPDEIGWHDDIEPPEGRPDGVPVSFLPDDYREVQPGPDSGMISSESFERGRIDTEISAEPSATPDPELIWDTSADTAPPTGRAARPQALVDASPCLVLRSDPVPDAQPLECVPTDTIVDVLGSMGTWTRVRVDGFEGWMASDLLLPLAPEAEPEPVTAPGISELEQKLREENHELRRQIFEREEEDRALEGKIRELEQQLEAVEDETDG